MSDQRVGKKEVEEALLWPFLEARQRVTGKALTFVESSERPDFICAHGNRWRVGVEVAEITYGPDEAINDEQAVEEVYRLIERKERSRCRPGWEYPGRTILVLVTQELGIADIAWLLPNDVRSDFSDHGFKEIWIADFTGYDAYGNVELFGLYPRRWWGHHRRPNPHDKPYRWRRPGARP
ncbi:MAG TPA: hypothetical protein VJY35_00915 [Candidatus Eisenbacteria bacterium]|nr:hypothetical protein [Candidatus Eisenbacteria bacterium]